MSGTARVLLIDDDAKLRKYVSRGLKRAELLVTTARDGRSGKELLCNETFDVVVSDLRMPDMDGLELLRFSRTLPDPPPFILFTAYSSVSLAVEAMRYGAEDFLEKPVDIKTVVETIQSVLTRNHGEGPPEEDTIDGFVGSGEWYKTFVVMLRRVARSNATVLIEGETGTGKSLVARACWRLSRRDSGPFVVLNCAAIPDQLLESELFGHVRGAFTGATTSRDGKVRQADGGTLFLDEVGELKADLQAKLLHLLQERRYQPVGSNQVKHADVRFIAATNRDLRQEVREGRFRADLYYRLNVLNLKVPALRERLDDVPFLLEYFSRLAGERWEQKGPKFLPETITFLKNYHWPGNVRELENLVERMVVMAPEEVISTNDITSNVPQAAAMQAALAETGSGIGLGQRPLLGKTSLGDAVRDFERDLIRQALDEADGNRSEAARLLSVKRTTLLAKLSRLGLDDNYLD